MWWFWKKRGEELGGESGSETGSQSVSQPVLPSEMALAWQWISYLQAELQKVNANVRSVHAHHDARSREMSGSLSGSVAQQVAQQFSGFKSQIHQETTALVSSMVEKKHQESLRQFGQFENSVRSSLGALGEKVGRVDVLESRMASVEAEIPKVVSALDSMRSRVEQASSVSSGARARSSLQERVERKVHRGGKDFLKQSIRSLVQKYGRLSALQIREILVDEQGLCSKSTLYRLLDEVEKEFSLSNEGREKVFSVLRT